MSNKESTFAKVLNWISQSFLLVDKLVLFILSLIIIAINIYDIFGLLDTEHWVRQRIPILTILFLALIAIQLLGDAYKQWKMLTENHKGVTTLLNDNHTGVTTLLNDNHTGVTTLLNDNHTGVTTLLNDNHTGVTTLLNDNHTGVTTLLNDNHTGVTTLLNDNKQELASLIKKGDVLRLLDHRYKLNDLYLRYFNASDIMNVNIVALTSEKLIEVYGIEGLISRIESPCQVKILILDPQSNICDYREKVSQDLSKAELKQRIRKSIDFYVELAKEIKSKEIDIKGSITVELYDLLPHFAYFQADDKIVMGLYYAYAHGLNAYAIEVAKDTGLSSDLKQHFSAILKSPTTKIIEIAPYKQEINADYGSFDS